MDEDRHVPDDDPSWSETVGFEFGNLELSVSGYTMLTLHPYRGCAWYFAALVRKGQPLLHVVDLELQLPSAGFRVRGTGLWADHICEEPYGQWTVVNECYASALDDPTDALRGALGITVPIAFDIEWYADGPVEPIVMGYQQRGEIEGVLELREGTLSVSVPSRRWHSWGADEWAQARGEARRSDGLVVPTVAGARVIERILTARGWAQTVA